MKGRAWTIGIVGAVAFPLVIFVVHHVPPDEPQVGNRNLSSWLEDLQLSGAYLSVDGIGVVIPSATPAQVEAATALRVIGTNAGPTLVRLLRARDGEWKRKLIEWSRKQPFSGLRLKSAGDKRNVALHALYELGPFAVAALTELTVDEDLSLDDRRRCVRMLERIGGKSWPAIPALLSLADHTNKELRLAAFQSLGAIGPMKDWPAELTRESANQSEGPARPNSSREEPAGMARTAVRTVATAVAVTHAAMETMASWEPDFTRRAILILRYSEAAGPRAGAARSLGRAASHPAIVVPVLIEGLRDKDGGVRAACAEALGELGGDARSAGPALTGLFLDERVSVRVAATNSLRRINAEADAGGLE